MIEFKGKIEGFLRDRETVLIGVPENYLPALEELFNNDVDVKIGKHREKRSLNANAYCWKLCSLIADELTKADAVVTKEDIYQNALFNYGQSQLIPLRSDVPPLKVFDYAIEHGRTKDKKGIDYIWYQVAIGSSKYNSEEMQILIRGIRQEAEALGIPTATPAEEAEMLERWGNEF